MVAAVLISVLTLLRSDFLVIVTLDLSETLRLAAIDNRSLIRGSEGWPSFCAFWCRTRLISSSLLSRGQRGVLAMFYRLVRSPFGHPIQVRWRISSGGRRVLQELTPWAAQYAVNGRDTARSVTPHRRAEYRSDWRFGTSKQEVP